MLVTELMKTPEGWRAFRRYYWFAGDRSLEPWTREARRPCPGCGREFTVLAQAEHVCSGGTEAWPQLARPRRPGVGGRPRKTG